MNISAGLAPDIQWWIKIFSDSNQTNAIRSGTPTREIFTDASLSGWGAACGQNYTRGWWGENERNNHINILELKAAYYSLKCFAADLNDCEILLRIDNTTAIACINRLGSVQYPHLNEKARKIWRWCEARNIFVFASYIASINNTIADRESRVVSDDTEWSLSREAYSQISSEYGPLDIDIFASIINAKCPMYVSWLPEPSSVAVDAFTLSWSGIKFYAFPPFILLPRVLRKILNEKAQGVVVVPWWPSQAWFPLFCSLLTKEPLIFPPSRHLLSTPFRDHHPAWRSLSLAAGSLSG
ncbi:PREDICTED: uncharacterized protein LOC105557372 [Vollenhovia emeryi]|uniref:uncharacterized protein LOC105557372 n=1 Tax=Vollenhovia emeryi TaxID=411798 RepID=UPI0005F44C0A|nr:PREDICTED: uncharacterized protein LOC105557372 [Vollenhovia emeryi]